VRRVVCTSLVGGRPVGLVTGEGEGGGEGREGVGGNYPWTWRKGSSSSGWAMAI
jgi:hypothetical protein